MRKTFGTEMAAIKDLMEGARGVGTNYGVGLDEQLGAVLHGFYRQNAVYA